MQKKGLLIVFVVFILLLMPLASLAEEGAEMLLFTEMPQVVTASKTAQDINKAPSIITVWTDQDIKQMGIRTTKELLQRTVGFFVNMQYASPIIGDRGMIADSNDAYLFMIDGHPINSIIQSGPGAYFVFPVLNNVKRVEIIRGPGSTLWGGDAALGVINFITKDGGDVDGLQVSADYSGNDQMRSQNILYGKRMGEKSEAAFSLTHMQANGFYEKLDDLKTGGPNDENYGTPNWGINPNSWIELESGGRQIGPIGEIYDSWEMHGKAKLDSLTLSAHISDLWSPDMWGLLRSPDKMFFLERQTAYLEGKQLQNILDNFTVEITLFGQAILNSQHASTYMSSPGITGEQEQDLGRELDWGGDLLFDLKLEAARQDIKFGVHSVLSELSPIYTYQSFDADANTGTITPEVSPHTNDLALAGFIEDDWKVFENLDVVVGLRSDSDSLRDATTAWLPRGGVVWNISGPMTVKYLYNTGYVRPEVNDGYLGGMPEKLDNTNGNYFQIGETQSEKITAHDLQFAYNAKETHASATLYRMELDNFFDYSGAFITGTDGRLYRMATVNTNNLTSDGLELEFRQKLTPQINCYGNYSFVLSSQVNQFEWNEKGFIATLANGAQFTDQREMTGFPRHSWNLGVNVSIIDNLTLNFHYRGWTGMWTEMKSPVMDGSGHIVQNAEYGYLGPQHFVDLNILYSKLLGLPLDLDLFVHNLLNNADSKISLPLQGGYWADEGFSLGAKVAYKF